MNEEEHDDELDIDPEETFTLSPEGLVHVAKMSVYLIDHGYDLGEPSKLWESASFLVAQEQAPEDMSVEDVAVLLTFASLNWNSIKQVVDIMMAEDESA